jgi:quinol monooxygenase YgiN
MFVLIVKLKIKEGKTDEFIKAFQSVIPDVSKEEGTLSYMLNRDEATPNALVIVERYRDKEAFAAHCSAPYIVELVGKIEALMDGSYEVSMLEGIASI